MIARIWHWAIRSGVFLIAAVVGAILLAGFLFRPVTIHDTHILPSSKTSVQVYCPSNGGIPTVNGNG
jgi:hypothetical protein